MKLCEINAQSLPSHFPAVGLYRNSQYTAPAAIHTGNKFQVAANAFRNAQQYDWAQVMDDQRLMLSAVDAGLWILRKCRDSICTPPPFRNVTENLFFFRAPSGGALEGPGCPNGRPGGSVGLQNGAKMVSKSDSGAKVTKM